VLAAALGVMALVLPASVPARERPATAGADWREVLGRAAEAARTSTYAGEVLLVVWEGDDSHVSRVRVHHSTEVGLVVEDAGDDLPDEGGGLIDHPGGWLLPLPDVQDAAGLEHGIDRLREKYAPSIEGVDRVLDRRCLRLVLHRRGDDLLRERLWFDESSGLLLRRETYADDGRLLRLAAYLSLDLRPPRNRRVRLLPTAARSRSPEGEHLFAEVGTRGLAALREAGWEVPHALPGGYDPVGRFAVDGVSTQPLQLVYADGLYRVSLFQQAGRPDWEALPVGFERWEDAPFEAYHWPGSSPARLVWEADGRTYSLVGDVPPDEVAAILAVLPAHEPTGLWQRLGRGFGRLWAMLSPWG
jgi:hypothetical protein